jgi:hypothetical protein
MNVMIIRNQVREPLEEVLAFSIGQAIDALDVMADSKY